MTIRVTSYGAAGTVTGSCHLIELGDRRVLVDCGMFQGTLEVEIWNREPLGFDPRSLDAVFVTHGHLDHCGQLPRLTQGGYRGRIHATRPTYDVVRLILIDSARIQYEDWANAHENIEGAVPDESVPPPLYSEQDVFETLDLFQTTGYNRPLDLGGGLLATFHNAGHILGSAFIEFDSPDGRVIASGDIGSWGESVVPSPTLPTPPADVVTIESTYGGRIHEPLPQAIATLAEIITQTVNRGGNVLIPTFALERAQDILFILRGLVETRQVPRIQVFLDSPLAINFTRLHRRYPEQLSDPVKRIITVGQDPFSFPDLQFTRTQAESRQIDKIRQGAVIMAGSGMATAGRILRHLTYNLERPESTVLFVGYQGEETLGRQLVEGAAQVIIHGEEYDVRAQIASIDGFSAHADEPMLLRWLAAARPQHVLLVHGEEPAPELLMNSILERHGFDTVISQRAKTYEFD
ncbi:MAG TPA: MBL fold metallo-hydrolase [Chloroflexi bacterium]|nr:MBL fold metallo-hydrolase [Chloroflexota bacterium]